MGEFVAGDFNQGMYDEVLELLNMDVEVSVIEDTVDYTEIEIYDNGEAGCGRLLLFFGDGNWTVGFRVYDNFDVFESELLDRGIDRPDIEYGVIELKSYFNRLDDVVYPYAYEIVRNDVYELGNIGIYDLIGDMAYIRIEDEDMFSSGKLRKILRSLTVYEKSVRGLVDTYTV